MTSFRLQKVSSQVRHVLAREIENNLKVPETIITVTDVWLSPDIKSAKIWVSIYGKSILTARNKLISMRDYLQKQLATELKTKFTPSIIFEFDKSAGYADKINRLLDNLK
jgi:ribosome-binding factor A